jgi:hypothetical protein
LFFVLLVFVKPTGTSKLSKLAVFPPHQKLIHILPAGKSNDSAETAPRILIVPDDFDVLRVKLLPPAFKIFLRNIKSGRRDEMVETMLCCSRQPKVPR